MSRILITGAAGFVGRHLTPRLVKAGHELVVAVNRRQPVIADGVRVVQTGPLETSENLARALEGVDTVIHLAGLANAGARAGNGDPYLGPNVTATERLAEAAGRAGAAKFINMSTIFAAAPNPATQTIDDHSESPWPTPYGQSKRMAEQHVQRLSQTGVLAVSLRPPQVIGADAGGIWGLLQRLAASNMPLPFGAVANARSFVSIDTLTDAITHLCAREWASDKSGAYCLADMETLSLPQAITELRRGMGKPARLFPVPASLLETGARLVGGQTRASSLFGNLRIDASRFFDVFDFAPATPLTQAVRESGRDYIAMRGA